MAKKKVVKTTDLKIKFQRFLLATVFVGLVMYQGIVVYQEYQASWFIFLILLIINLGLFFIFLNYFIKKHHSSIGNLERALEALAQTGQPKTLHLHSLDKESSEIARYVNKIISSVKEGQKDLQKNLTVVNDELVKQKAANEEIEYQIKELKIFNHIADRIAYSQNISAIVEVIAGSLGEILSYTSVAYVLLEEDLLTFHIRLEEPVSQSYLEEIKQKMIDSLIGLTNSIEIQKMPTDEIVTGSVVDDSVRVKVGSFFNGPLVIGGKIVGVLNVAAVKVGHFSEQQMGVLFQMTKKVSAAVESLRRILDEEKGKLNAMVSSISDGLLVVDNHSKVMIANPAFKIMLNLALPEITMLDIVDKMHGIVDVRSKLQEAIKMDKLIAENDFLFGELYLRPIFSPVRDKNGAKIGAVMLLQDVTKEKELQRLREDFTSMMVHELRSPLDGIKKMSELMRLEGYSDANAKEHADNLQMIKNASANMLELVNDLLDVAKLESGKFQIYPEVNDIKRIINERVAFFQALASDSKITLSAIIDKAIVENFKFDALRIVQVLNNFISNALKFSRSGEKVTIQVLLHNHGQNIKQEAKEADVVWFLDQELGKLNNLPSSIVVAVTDSGVGISLEEISKLFNKFQQLKTSETSSKKGTGLGLAIAKGIVKAHQGVVGVESQEGKGSTFYFTLPTILKHIEQ